ncbi:hypothetical protein PVA48_10760 [Akkermansia sp. JRP_AM1]|uniref:hypothetical protein n=1 Tax=Akkermansia sp. JRP_AM1 TaxID=3414159 RepID=UPI003BFA77BC
MSLSLQPTALSVLLAVLVMAAGVWMSRTACKRNRRPLTFKLELLRLVILGAICFLLFQPEWVVTSAPQEKPKVSILEDRSGSMETQDVEITPQHVVTRTAYAQELIKGNSTESLKDTHVVESAAFGSPLRRIPRITPWPARTWPSRWRTPCNPRTTCGRSSCSRTAATTPPPPC